MKSVLRYLWQLPQNLLGEILILLYRARDGQDYRDVRIHYTDKIRGGISLGRHIIMNPYLQSESLKKHEWGHTRQSLRLGWLYLPVIGLPSLLWASRPRADYFSFWTERRANLLGGVDTPASRPRVRRPRPKP